jgi:hypothetical protein
MSRLQQLQGHKSRLLEYVTCVDIPAIERFVVADAFGPNNPAGINFLLDDDFKIFFFRKVEENVKPATIAVHRLKEPLYDSDIIAELGPEGVIRLAHFYELIKAQANGETGPLLNKEGTNIAYIESDDRDVQVVFAGWHPLYRGWVISTFSIMWPIDKWSAGDLVLSYKPA